MKQQVVAVKYDKTNYQNDPRLTTRQHKLLTALGDTGCFSRESPRMSRKEYDVLTWELGYRIQCSSLHGADISAGYIYTWLDK
jgi:hypothetical protein